MEFNLVDELKKLPREFQNRMNEKRDNELDEAFEQGYSCCQLKTLDILIDTQLNEEKIIELLQRHFDLRLSEAEDMIRAANNRKAKKASEQE